VDGVTVTVIVTNVTVHHQVLGVRVMTAGEMIADVTTDGVTIVAVTIVAVTTVVVTTDGVTIVDAMTVDAMTVDAMTVDAMNVDAMTVDAMNVDAMTVDAMNVDAMFVDAMNVDAMIVGVTTVTGRWLGGDVIEMSVTVHQGILGVLTVIAVIGIVEAVKETALEEIEIVMIVIALGGGMSVQMIVTVIVIRGELEGMSQVVISGDENHPLHVLKENPGQRPVAVANDPLQSNQIQRVGPQFSTNEEFTLPWRVTELNSTYLLDLICTAFQPIWICHQKYG